MLDALSRVNLLRALPPEGLAALAIRGRKRTFSAGGLLAQQGQVSACVHVILTGRVRVERAHAQFVLPVVLAELGTGDTVGELGLFDGAPQPVTAVAVEPTETLELATTTLLEVLQEFADLRPELRRTLTWRSATSYVAAREPGGAGGGESASSVGALS